MNLYSLRREKKEVSLVWRESEEPNYDTGEYETEYGSVLLSAIVLPVKRTIETGEQESPYNGGYYDANARVFLFDTPHDELKIRNWIVYDGVRYDINQVDVISGLYRVLAKQETEVATTNYIIQSIRSTIFTEVDLES